MKIRQIEVFLAVAETGGVRRAANRLCITQSAVAKAISQLEIIATHSGEFPRFLRCAYHAKVMKQFERRSKAAVLYRTGI
jgi:hypothetical protein